MKMLKQEAVNWEKILIVDDDRILGKFLQSYLSGFGFAVEHLLDGHAMPRFLEKNRIDLVVLDVVLPNKDGIYWLRWLKQYHPHIRTILTSVKNDEDNRLIGLESGAMDFLSKPFHDKELLIRINNILRKRSFFDEHRAVTVGGLILDFENNMVTKNDEKIRLTLLESNILKLLYLNVGAPVSRDDIMLQIRGASYHPLDRSIDIHVNKLRKKIEEDPSNPVYIRTVRGKGYCLHVNDYYV